MALEDVANSEIRKINREINRAIKKGVRTAGEVMKTMDYDWKYLVSKGIYGGDIKAKIVRKAVIKALETAESMADVIRTTEYNRATIKKYSKGLKLPRGKPGRRRKKIGHDTIAEKIEYSIYEGGAESIQEICNLIHESYDDVKETAGLRNIALPDGRSRTKRIINETPRNPRIDALVDKKLALREMARRAGKKNPYSLLSGQN